MTSYLEKKGEDGNNFFFLKKQVVTSCCKFGVTSIFLIDSTEILKLQDFLLDFAWFIYMMWVMRGCSKSKNKKKQKMTWSATERTPKAILMKKVQNQAN